MADPRTTRTRQLLQDALRKLLGEKPLDQILVQDITGAATVNRATFYDHYNDKFALFNALIAADFQKMLEQRNVCLDESCTMGLSAIILTAGDYLQTLHRDQAVCAFQASTEPLIDSAVTLAIRRVILDGLEKQTHAAPMPREVVASLASGAIYAAVKEWLSQTSWRADERSLSSLVPLILPLIQQREARN